MGGMGYRAWLTAVTFIAGCSFATVDADGDGNGVAATDSGGTSQGSGSDPSNPSDPSNGSATTTNGGTTTAMPTTSPTATATASETASGEATGSTTTGVGACTAGDWWDAAWQRRRRLSVEPLPTPNDLNNVPVLVRLDDGRIEQDVAAADGRDIRFVADDGTVLPHEIETWDGDGTAAVWVRVPQLSGRAPTQWWMYYGNPDAEDASDPETLWSAYLSVHHLTDWSDASGNGKDAVTNTPPTAVEGRAGGAHHFDGDDDYLELTDEAYFDLLGNFAISVWVRVEVFDTNWQTVVVKGDRQWRIHRNSNRRQISFGTTAEGNQWNNIPGEATIDDDAWHHIAVVYDGNGRRIFVDGQADANDDWSATQNDTDYTVYIGENNQATGRHFHGDIDELRISTLPRGRGWYDTQFRSAIDDLIAYGPRDDCE